MSLFNIIAESALNEIGAEDAYNRFYSEIPRDEYDLIVGGEKNVDKFVQFFLNAVRDGFDANEAADILKKIKTADNIVRQKVLNAFRENLFEDPYDVDSYIDKLNSGSVVLSRRQFAKDGYDVLKEDENWVLSVTTNYAANSHYFGKSHWCTASDRNGRWDGYKMFIHYTIENNCALFQVINKQNINKSFQVSVDSSGVVHECCDWEDYSIEYDIATQSVPVEIISEISTNAEKYVNKTSEMADKEAFFENGEEALIKKKRELKAKKREKKIKRLEIECEAKNQKIEKKIDNCWKYVIDNELHKNISFLSNVFGLYNTGHGAETTEEALKTNFVGLGNIVNIEDNIFLGIFGTLEGDSYRVIDDFDDDDSEPSIESTFFEGIEGDDSNGVYVIFEPSQSRDRIEKIFYVSDPISHGKVEIYGTRRCDGNYGRDDRFYTLMGAENGNNIFFDARDKRMHNVGNAVFSSYITSNNYTWCFGYDQENFETGEIYTDIGLLSPNADKLKQYRGKVSVKDEICTFNIDNKTIVCGRTYGDGGDFMFEINNKWKVISTDASSIFSGNEVLTYTNEDYDENMAFMDYKDDLIFGEWGRDTGYSPDFMLGPALYIWIRKKLLVYTIKDGKYYEIEGDGNGGAKPVECDKYGITEKERVAKKNFVDWQKQGGHSPEVKAQMDKMYQNQYNTNFPNSDELWRQKADDDMEEKRSDARFNAYMNDKNDPDDETFKRMGNGSHREGFKKYYNNKIRFNPRMNDWEDWDEDNEIEPKFDNMSKMAGMNESAKKMASMFKRLRDM